MILARRRIALWVEERDGEPAVNPILRETLRACDAAGARTRVLVPERHAVDAADPARSLGAVDLILLKSATAFALSCALAMEAAGVRSLNAARATVRAHDKAAVVGYLAAAGLPVPPTFLHVPPATSEHDPPGAWIAKPTYGVHGAGLVRGASFAGARDQPGASSGTLVVDDGTRLLQAWIGGQDPDTKVYVAGDRSFAGVKRSTPTSYRSDDIAPIELDEAAAAIVRATGDALGLRCYGVDLRYEAGRPVIIDANPFPGYRGFPGAAAALFAEIERALGPS